jgi:hypothetical protein
MTHAAAGGRSAIRRSARLGSVLMRIEAPALLSYQRVYVAGELPAMRAQ